MVDRLKVEIGCNNSSPHNEITKQPLQDFLKKSCCYVPYRCVTYLAKIIKGKSRGTDVASSRHLATLGAAPRDGHTSSCDTRWLDTREYHRWGATHPHTKAPAHDDGHTRCYYLLTPYLYSE